MSRYKVFDRSQIRLQPLDIRVNNIGLEHILPLDKVVPDRPEYKALALRIGRAKQNGAANILMMGGHVIRSGVQRYIIDLMEKDYISCIAMNGAGMIHDFEFAMIGATTESVARYIQKGEFGLWHETGRINDVAVHAHNFGLGLGEAVGQEIMDGRDYQNKDISILGAGYRLGIPVTVHVGIGQDIVHQFPNCSGEAYGAASYRDFLIYVKSLESLEHGVIMNFGSAVMAPEVYLKGLAMVRNAASQRGEKISRFSTLVCDLVELPEDYKTEAGNEDPRYFFRPWKTMLVRTVADGGESFYIKALHADSIPMLWSAINR